MMKNIEKNGMNHTFTLVTAIAGCDLENGEYWRQEAILVEIENGEEKDAFVVFGYGFPEDEEDFNNMCSEPSAWENDADVLATVERIGEELADSIRSKDTWDLEELEKLCELAGLEEEWQNADGESLERVAYKAAEILNVEIV